MTPDTHERSEFNLDSSTDAQLNELFAVEVAGLRPFKGDLPEYLRTGKHYTTDANAVLPWLGCSWRAQQSEPGTVWVDVDSPAFGTATAPTFPRAAVIALIRAKRAGK